MDPGTRVGSYEIVEQIGAGGMGEVYRARDTRLSRDVAIKTMSGSLARNSERLARFEPEARLLAALNHPNVGAIYGVEEAAGRPALVLELVEGQTLHELIRARGSGLPLEEAVGIARQIADALDAAHEKGINNNVLADRDGNVARKTANGWAPTRPARTEAVLGPRSGLSSATR